MITDISKFNHGDAVKVERLGTYSRSYTLTKHDGEQVASWLIRKYILKKAAAHGNALRFVQTKRGGYQWRSAPIGYWMNLNSFNKPTTNNAANVAAEMKKGNPKMEEKATEPAQTIAFSHVKDELVKSPELRPANLIISDVKWKYLYRSTIRGKNLLMTGPSGCGKTLAAQTLAKVQTKRPFFYFNLGATQDPRSSLIGNTHYAKDSGTFFGEALFVKAIQTPKAIILLDELSRAHPDAANILMTVLDENQRYLRIDERDDTPTIKVAEGVTFIATANTGSEYTAARVMDRALLDRFITIEMEPLALEPELGLLTALYPQVDKKNVKAVAEIACHTRDQVRSEDPKVNSIISTRMTVEMVSLLYDGFSLAECAEVCIYPFFSPAGGVESERTYMQQLVQKYLPTKLDDKEKPWEDVENKIPFDVK